MNRRFFSELALPDPKTNLNVGKGTANDQISKIVAKLGTAFDEERPDLAIVPGDTSSAMAAGIACSKAGVSIAHLEAGCRSGDFRMSEEVNRRILDHLSNILLCPTAGSAKNVRSERVLAEVVKNVGDTMYDSVLKYSHVLGRIDTEGKYGVSKGRYAFMTLHRAETVDNPETLGEVLSAVGAMDTKIVFSVHPRTRDRLQEFGIREPANVKELGPLPYLDTLALVSGSQFVITDSGGLQKESFWFGRPTLITRNQTEWVEIVKAGASILVGTAKERIIRGARRIEGIDRRTFERSKKLFGEGEASKKVVETIRLYIEQAART
jgi:UDP-GlcNAc3NAcA epimerase